MDYVDNKEQIIKDNLKSTSKEKIEEFLNSPDYREWISDYKKQNIKDPIEEWIASGIRLWRDGWL
ncbi:hypothetical protein J5751_02855 [bacterium]|nr:hypothetical protein [bacterium]